MGLVGTAWANAAYCVNLAIPLCVAYVLVARAREGDGNPLDIRQANRTL
jgi:hypothetical protein